MNTFINEQDCLIKRKVSIIFFVLKQQTCSLTSPLRAVQRTACTVDTMVLWPGGTANVPQKQFWIIALLSLYSVPLMFSLWLHHFLTLSTQEKKKRIAEKEE